MSPLINYDFGYYQEVVRPTLCFIIYPYVICVNYQLQLPFWIQVYLWISLRGQNPFIIFWEWLRHNSVSSWRLVFTLTSPYLLIMDSFFVSPTLAFRPPHCHLLLRVHLRASYKIFPFLHITVFAWRIHCYYNNDFTVDACSNIITYSSISSQLLILLLCFLCTAMATWLVYLAVLFYFHEDADIDISIL